MLIPPLYPAVAYRGRFAPSPSGPLHLGSLLTALGSWLDARAAGGEWLLRIEDIDPPREQPGAAAQIQQQLHDHGLYWDRDILWQSQRSAAYQAVLTHLQQQQLAYICRCSRKQIKQQGRTIILTTHYMDEAEQLCDDLIIVDKGQIIAQGSPQALLRQHFEGALLQLPDPGFIPSLPDGHHTSLQGGQLCIQTPDVQQSIQALLQQQVQLQGLLVKSATLDDLFLKLTGHALSGVTMEAE